jgi:CheY-like chemotaxis protein/HPt (histidine-containing phosphotransfer) domain-containing protein
LEILRAGTPPDLVLIDLHMPEMDGLTLARRIQGMPEGRKIPLVFLTGIGDRLDRESSNAVSACLTRPIKPPNLFAVLEDLLLNAGSPGLASVRGAAAMPADETFSQRAPLRILLAEDHIVNQKVALRMLERLGYHADVAANGFEVLAALERQPYDLILMDVQMPDLDGLETTVRVRRRWAGSSTRVQIIAMTAYAFQSDLERCLAAGMDGYISKPIRLEALMDVLSRVYETPQAGVRGVVALPPNDDSSGVVDSVRIHDLLESLGDGLNDVIDTFLEDTPRIIADMQSAQMREDWEVLHRLAHSLKSSSGIFGAEEMAQICRGLETDTRARRAPSGDPIGEVTAAFQKVRTVLNLYRKNQ